VSSWRRRVRSSQLALSYLRSRVVADPQPHPSVSERPDFHINRRLTNARVRSGSATRAGPTNCCATTIARSTTRSGDIVENHGLRDPVQAGRVLGRGPDVSVKQLQERSGSVDGLEIEVDDDEVVVVDRSAQPGTGDARRSSHVGEAVEGAAPRVVIGDGMFDVESGHVLTVRTATVFDHPNLLGLAVP